MVSWKGDGDYFDGPNERLLNHPSAIENTSTRSGITLEPSQHPEKSELTADDGTDQILEWMDEEEQIDGGGEGDRTPDPCLQSRLLFGVHDRRYSGTNPVGKPPQFSAKQGVGF